jgi:hypothetical protein
VNYDDDKIDRTFLTSMAAARGTELHELAHTAIRLGVKLQGTKTLSKYVNDCIGFRMTPEQILFYSINAFGTADAISFRKNVLRISDLKTGVIPAKPAQLEIYAAFFCLEYGVKPYEITRMEMRIYQNDEIDYWEADPNDIAHIMDKIQTFDKRITRLREEAEL